MSEKTEKPQAAPEIMSVQEFRMIVGRKADSQTDQEIRRFICKCQAFASASYREYVKQQQAARPANVIANIGRKAG